MKKLICLIIVICCFTVSCSSKSYPHTIISSQEFGDAWPFTVSQGILVCKGSSGIGEVVFIANGKEYAVNGVAMANRKYRKIEEIYDGGSLGPIINRGLELCK